MESNLENSETESNSENLHTESNLENLRTRKNCARHTKFGLPTKYTANLPVLKPMQLILIRERKIFWKFWKFSTFLASKSAKIGIFETWLIVSFSKRSEMGWILATPLTENTVTWRSVANYARKFSPLKIIWPKFGRWLSRSTIFIYLRDVQENSIQFSNFSWNSKK